MSQIFYGLLLVYLGDIYFAEAAIIDCYVCSSKNNSNPACTDPFHPIYNQLSVGCHQGMEGRQGLFPARYCIKMKGESSIDGTETIIRYCSLKTFDNMCGKFKFEDVPYTGCIVSCDKRACNGSSNNKVHVFLLSCLMLIIGYSQKA